MYYSISELSNVHYFEQKSNTGLEIELLQRYLYIPLDIFQKKCKIKIYRSGISWMHGFCF